jgi:hypothetical protein
MIATIYTQDDNDLLYQTRIECNDRHSSDSAIMRCWICFQNSSSATMLSVFLII